MQFLILLAIVLAGTVHACYHSCRIVHSPECKLSFKPNGTLVITPHNVPPTERTFKIYVLHKQQYYYYYFTTSGSEREIELPGVMRMVTEVTGEPIPAADGVPIPAPNPFFPPHPTPRGSF